MKVVLMQDIMGVGRRNDVKDVADGYAYNFLLPKKLAKIATAELIEKAQTEKANQVARKGEIKENLKEIAQKIANLTLKFKAKVSEQGHLYAGITEKDIAEKLELEAKVEIVKKNIKMEKHIKELGEHTVEIRLSDDIIVKIKVIVEKEEESK